MLFDISEETRNYFFNTRTIIKLSSHFLSISNCVANSRYDYRTRFFLKVNISFSSLAIFLNSILPTTTYSRNTSKKIKNYLENLIT